MILIFGDLGGASPDSVEARRGDSLASLAGGERGPVVEMVTPILPASFSSSARLLPGRSGSDFSSGSSSGSGSAGSSASACSEAGARS